MRASVFNLVVRDFPTPGTSLLYNALTGAFLEADAEVAALFDRLAAGDVTGAEVEAVDPAWMDDDAGFVVASAEADEKAFRDWYEGMRSKSDTLSAIVSITLACNLDCTYCCQADVMDGRGMKAETASATAAWLAARARDIGSRRIDIAFVGGEPLLYPGRIEQIVRETREHAGEGVQVVFSLITNGVFMTRELVEKWVPLGLHATQVTLDGDEHTHGLTRKSKKKGADDGFARIFANVIDCAPLIRIHINGNYQDDTKHGFPALIAKLKDAGLAPGTKLHFSPALAALGAPPEAGGGSCTMAGSSPEIMVALKDRITAAGFDAGDWLNIGPCGFHLHHYYAVDPEGHLYKCPGFLGKSEWAMGHVRDGLDELRYRRFVEARPHEKSCGGCPNRPDCAGGCVAAEWVKRGEAEGVNCEGEIFHRLGDDLLKRKYAHEVLAADGIDPASVLSSIDVSFAPPERAGRRSPALRVLAA